MYTDEGNFSRTIVYFSLTRPRGDIKMGMAKAIVEEFPFLKDEEGQGFVSTDC